MADGFSERYGDLLYGSYDCVDRIVLNAYYPLGYNPGGFRTWWRRLHGDDEQLDNAHLMRMAGRFARRVRASAAAHGIPVIDCKRGERKHEIAEEYLATHRVDRGVFLILVARAVAPVWEVTRSTGGVLCNLAKKRAFVNHYSFHILDPEWGHMTIKMSGHPPFGAQVILNGHEYVAAAARAGGIGYVKEGNCFTRIADPAGLAQIADTLSQPATIGRLAQVMRPVDLHRLPVLRPGPRRAGTAAGSATATRSIRPSTAATCCSPSAPRWTGCSTGSSTAPGPGWTCRSCGPCSAPSNAPAATAPPTCHFEARRRDRDTSVRPDPVQAPLRELDVEGLHQRRTRAALRGDRAQHQALRCGRVLDNFPTIIGQLAGMVDRFTTTLDCVDTTFIADDLLDRLPAPAQLGATRVGGVDLNKPRIRGRAAAVLALSAASGGFTVAEFTAKVHAMTGNTGYTIRQAAYDLRKLRGKELITKPGRTRRYHLDPPHRGHHRRPAHPARARHRAHPRRGPQPPDGTQTHHLDQRRPRLREDPHRHANPLPATWASAPPHRQHLVDRSFVSA